jgi:hypothetical protein
MYMISWSDALVRVYIYKQQPWAGVPSSLHAVVICVLSNTVGSLVCQNDPTRNGSKTEQENMILVASPNEAAHTNVHAATACGNRTKKAPTDCGFKPSAAAGAELSNKTIVGTCAFEIESKARTPRLSRWIEVVSK